MATESTAQKRRRLILRAWETRDTFSTTASAIIRNLSFVGLGFVLLLGGVAQENYTRGEVIVLTTELIVAAVLLLASLMLDLAQYVYGTAAYGIWARLEERRLDKKGEVPKERFPARMNIPTSCFFWLKILTAVVAYSIVLHYLLSQVASPS